jgi:hypothetical protein
MAFIVGWGSAWITAMLFMKNIASDVAVLKALQREHECTLAEVKERQRVVIQVIEEHMHVKIQ